MLDFTVAIPTYNGAARLPLVLAALAAQRGTESLTWEIWVIDNNSRDTTAQVVQDYQAQWPCSYPLHYGHEARQGLAYARQRAIELAAGCYVAFLDDDNLPAPDWVQAAYHFGEQHRPAGAFSGRICGRYEVEPPANFSRIAQFLAIRDHGPEARRFRPEHLQLPPGAGLVVRRSAWLAAVPRDLAIAGNQGKLLARGEDYEALLHLHRAGWEIWYNPAMSLDHLIPPWRLERSYLLNLARTCGLATYELRLVTAPPGHGLWLYGRTLLGNLKRLALHLLKYRGRVRTDLIAAFELTFHYYSLVSPFYHQQQQRRRSRRP